MAIALPKTILRQLESPVRAAPIADEERAQQGEAEREEQRLLRQKSVERNRKAHGPEHDRDQADDVADDRAPHQPRILDGHRQLDAIPVLGERRHDSLDDPLLQLFKRLERKAVGGPRVVDMAAARMSSSTPDLTPTKMRHRRLTAKLLGDSSRTIHQLSPGAVLGTKLFGRPRKPSAYRGGAQRLCA